VAVASVVASTAILVVRGWAYFVVGPVVFVLTALGAQLLLERGRLRAALEAFLWISRWELSRARAEIGESIPRSQRAARAWTASGDMPLHAASVDALVGASTSRPHGG
jgi:hypothetical protein